jgi:sulfonate transport system ATP-binding protein
MHRLVQDLWQAHEPSVLLVTHDVDEALRLAQRILVLAGGRIVSEYEPGEHVRAKVLADLGVSESATA